MKNTIELMQNYPPINLGVSLPSEDILSSHTVEAYTGKLQCSMWCSRTTGCAGFYFVADDSENFHNCQLTKESEKSDEDKANSGIWTLFSNIKIKVRM